MQDSKSSPALVQAIVAACAAQNEYLYWRNLYSAILDDTYLLLSPNYDLIMARIAKIGADARDKARDTRMELFSLLDPDYGVSTDEG